MTFMTVHNYLTLKLYCNTAINKDQDSFVVKERGMLRRMQDWDFRTKNIAIFAASDFCASLSKIMFEVRKQ